MNLYPPEAIQLHGTGNMILAPGEFFITCPYDRSHQALNMRFFNHVLRCRRMYSLKKRKSGDSVVMLSCKYNHHHQVPAPEIRYHEIRCQDKRNVFLDYVLREVETGNKEEFLKDLQRVSDTEHKTMKQVIRRYNSAVIVPYYLENLSLKELLQGYNRRREEKVVEDVVPNPEKAKLEGISPMQTMTEPEETFSRRSARLFPRQLIAKLNPGGHRPEIDPNSEEYWETNDKRPASNYMSNFKKLDNPTLKYPPYLTKSERKKFVAYNTHRMVTERGVQPDPQENQ